MFKNNIEENYQVFTKNKLCNLANYFTMLRELASDIIKDSYQPPAIAKRLNNIVGIMQKNIVSIIDHKIDIQNHDYVLEFYQNHINSLKAQISQLKQQKSIGSKNLLQLENNIIQIGQFNRQQSTNMHPIVNFTQIIRLKKQIFNSSQLLLENQALLKQQNQIIKNLKQYIKQMQIKENKNRNKMEQKIEMLDQQINKNKTLFQGSVKHLSEEKITYEKQIKELELLNLKYLEERDRIDEELVQKNLKIKQMARKNYDLSLKSISIQRENSPYFKIQTEQNINILQAEISALKKKCQFIQRQWESKLQSKILLIAQMQPKLAQLKSQNILKSDQIVQINQRYHQIKEKQLILQKKIAQLTIKYEKLNRQYAVVESKKRFMEHEQKTNEFKIKQYEKMITQNQKQKSSSSDRVIKMGQMIISIRNNHEKEKTQIKEEIFAQLQNLMKLNKFLQVQIKTQKQQNKQLYLRNQQLQQEKRLKEINLTKLQQQNKSLQEKLQQQSQQKYKLQSINEDLMKQLQQIKQQMEFYNKQESLSSFSNSQNLPNLEEILIKKDLSIQKKQSQIDKLLMQNKTLKQKIKYPSDNFEDQSEIIRLQKDLSRKDFEIRQLESKLKIIQQQLRQCEKVSNNQKEKMNYKIKQLQQLLSDRYSFSSR